MEKSCGLALNVGVLACGEVIRSFLKTRDLRLIEWRGKKYEVKGPLDVRPL